jgi:NADH:ubiquinone oxidoreductase subunit E
LIEVNVCIGSACHLKGSYNVVQTFQQLIESNGLHDKVELKGHFCMKRCKEAVSVAVGDEVFSVQPENAREFFKNTVMAIAK